METKTLEKTCDIVVVGAGHAGCEASLACFRTKNCLQLSYKLLTIFNVFYDRLK